MAELTQRYVVMTVASELPFDPHDPEGVFVLKPWKDPAALRAVQTYRDHCYPELAHDLDTWISAIVTGPSVRGDVGRRNEPHVRVIPPAPDPKAPRAARRPVAKAGARRPAVKRKRRAR